MHHQYRKPFHVISLILLLSMFTATLVWADGPQPVLVKDITPGPNGSALRDLTNVNGTLFFTVQDWTNFHYYLWKSDGTEAGTMLIKKVQATNLIAVGDILFFYGAADDGTERGLWKSDGTAAGTVLVKEDRYTDLTSVDVDGVLFFANRSRLWRSDGTPAGTYEIKQFHHAFVYGVNVNSTFFFNALENRFPGQGAGLELWKSDGTNSSTVLVKDINPGPGSSDPYHLFNHNGTLFFIIEHSDVGELHQLWRSDGFSQTTTLVKNGFYPGYRRPSEMTSFNENLYFFADTAVAGDELWVTDGTSEGTTIVQTIDPPLSSGFTYNLTQINGALYYQHQGLWKSDGTAAGTVKVMEANNLISLISAGDTLFFILYVGSNTILWTSDGTSTGTIPLTQSGPASVSNLIDVNGRLFFTADDDLHGRELWTLEAGNDDAPVSQPIHLPIILK